MPYALVVCPNCYKMRIVEQGKEKTRCQFCRKEEKLEGLRFFRVSNDQDELRAWKATLTAEMAGKDDEFIQELLREFRDDPRKRQQKGGQKRRSEKNTALEVLKELGLRCGEEGFTYGDFALRLREKRSDMNAKDWLENLQREALVYKGKDGRYRVV